jgi:Fur family transcriptional regulator, ferric uptake regulator
MRAAPDQLRIPRPARGPLTGAGGSCACENPCERRRPCLVLVPQARYYMVSTPSVRGLPVEFREDGNMHEKAPREERDIYYSYLRQNGLKKTRQKDLILQTFLDTEGHLSVEDVYSLVKKRDNKVGVVTVFRTLKSLAACGIAREMALGDGRTRFEHCYHHPHHHHIICTQCHKAIEFLSLELEKIQNEIVARYRFEPLRHRFQIYGICGDCRDRRQMPETRRHDTEKVFARDALRMALSMEKRALEFYRTAAALNQDLDGRGVLERIGRESAAHLSALEARLVETCRQEDGLEQAPMFLHFDPCELEELIPNLEECRTEGELRLDARRALDLAVTLTQRTAGFFKRYADRLMETEGKRVLERFADEEALQHSAAG